MTERAQPNSEGKKEKQKNRRKKLSNFVDFDSIFPLDMTYVVTVAKTGKIHTIAA